MALRAFFAAVLMMLGGQALAAPSPRTITALSEGWAFRFGDAPETVKSATFDDSAWERVSVPHTWNRVGEYALTRSAGTNNKQGIGWYRLSYDAKPMAKGRRIYIDFAAVGNIADVWVNGAHVGQHKGAFTRFRFDVTPQWKPGAKNLIVVRADNSKPAVGSSTEHVIPLAGDFFIHGGLYRGVQLIEANDVGIDLLDFGGPGVYVRTGPVKGKEVVSRGRRTKSVIIDTYVQAEVSVSIKIRNFRKRLKRDLNYRFIVRDQSGVSVVSNGPLTDIPIMPDFNESLNRVCGYYDENGTHLYRVCKNPIPVDTVSYVSNVATLITLNDPREWNGKADQHLYTLTVEVRDGQQLIDSVTQSFGIRDFKFDPSTGLTLNGKPLKLQGVSRHQDKLGKGWALTRADHAEDMALMKEMGVNSVRHAHYPHADEWVEEADKAGMIVWAEVPYVTTPSLSGGEGSAEIFANAEQQTRELIRQNYNHPSIAMWAAGNEVDASALFGLTSAPTRPRKLLDHINKIIKEEDPSRASVFADCCEDVRSPVAGLAAQEQGEKLAGATDLIGYNRYYGWYYPQPLKAAEQLAREMDKLHAKHPTLPISISEYGAGGAFGQHSDNVMTGFINAIGRPQAEEYESWVHEQSWPVIRDRKYIFGSWVWNMFDFASDLRNEGDSVDINTKGLVSFDRKVKKDAFYYYKAQWSKEDFIHLTGKRYLDRAYSQMDVKAYTNQPKAFLSVNGDRGPMIPADCPGGICIWKDVKLAPGPNKFMVAVGTTDRGMPVQLDDSATFNGPDPAKGIRIDAGDIASSVLPVAPAKAGASSAKSATLALTSPEAPAYAGATRLFGSDNFVTGGTPAVLNQGGFGGRGAPKRTVTAPDPALYDYWREGEAFSYAIPVPDGKWTVTIHSFATAGSTGTMSVSADGKPALPAFNIAKAAGGAMKGLARSFPVTVKGGILTLDFAGQSGKAIVAAIEIVK